METLQHIPHTSEILYVGMCNIIGTPTQVKIRRDVMDTHEKIYQLSNKCKGIMESGSFREGFRLATSDRDMMFWSLNEIVIYDLSQIPPYHPTQILILMECHDTPPGFAKLQLLTPTNNPIIKQSSISVNDHVYISSSLHREVMHNGIQLTCDTLFQSLKLHGPCTSGFFATAEYDHAFCFSCKHWPLPAYHWIERSQRQGWPFPQVLQDIIEDGCHLVAIGSRRSTSSQQCETEWRMSFSQAEYKLVYSMNHTQFLCYGVLKIFLKEVLNVGLKDPLLCSYFMKTTLFWKIQGNTIPVWCSENTLHCVWMCFKYLIQCVYKGEFPNFFIPKNNTFINKIHGAAQKQLFLHLMTLYNMGFSCLLLSPSLYKILSKVILNPQLQVSTDEHNIISEVELDVELNREINTESTGMLKTYYSLNNPTSLVLNIDYLYKTTSVCSQIHTSALHVMRNFTLLHDAFYLDKLRENNMHTTENCTPLDMLISAADSGYISDALYVGMYLYNKRRYTEALHYIETTKQKLCLPFVLNIATKNVNRYMYMEAVRGMSFIDKIRKAVSFDIFIDQNCCIDELRLEVYAVTPNPNFLIVPSIVMAHMLSFLCHHHLGDRLRSRQSLHDLLNLLYYDEGQYINSNFRDISWQMLGVCEQIHGDKERALYSYQQAYNTIQYPYQQINTASWTRIQNIISK